MRSHCSLYTVRHEPPGRDQVVLEPHLEKLQDLCPECVLVQGEIGLTLQDLKAFSNEFSEIQVKPPVLHHMENGKGMSPEAKGILPACRPEPKGKGRTDSITSVCNAQDGARDGLRKFSPGPHRQIMLVDGRGHCPGFSRSFCIHPSHHTLKIRELSHHLGHQVCLGEICCP